MQKGATTLHFFVLWRYYIMAESIETRVTRLETKHSNLEKRVANMENINKDISDINLNIQKLADNQSQMLEVIKEEKEARKDQDKRLTTLENKPAQNYEKLKWIIITAIVGAIVSGVAGWLIGFFGK